MKKPARAGTAGRPRNQIVVPAIENGTVIDHIPPSATLKVVQILSRIDDLVTIGINFPSASMGRKGVVKIANQHLTPREVDKIAVLAPAATVNIIRGFKVREKIRVKIPAIIEGLVRCKNPACITNHEAVRTKFKVLPGAREVECHYCERPERFGELELL
ncbi:MAG: aspartate carbamoyltransferase regulatory subunit [Planctomycetota bacterium]